MSNRDSFRLNEDISDLFSPYHLLVHRSLFICVFSYIVSKKVLPRGIGGGGEGGEGGVVVVKRKKTNKGPKLKENSFSGVVLCKQLVCRPETTIYQRPGPSKTEKFHPAITFFDLMLTFQPFVCLETF